jgi:hypothetical protein
MKTKGDVDVLVRLLSQLHGLHVELSQLAKKSSNDAVKGTSNNDEFFVGLTAALVGRSSFALDLS